MRKITWLLSLLLAAGSAGCTALRPLVAPSARQCPWIEADPSALGGPERLELRARVTAPGVDHAFTLAVERTGDSLVAVGLNALGTKSFEVERRGKRSRAVNHMGLAAVVPPRNVLADITGILAASPCAASSLPEATAELGRWTITDTCSGGRPLSRHVRGPGEVGNVDITWQGGEILVTQHDCLYEARYVRVGDGAASVPAVSSAGAASAKTTPARPAPYVPPAPPPVDDEPTTVSSEPLRGAPVQAAPPTPPTPQPASDASHDAKPVSQPSPRGRVALPAPTPVTVTPQISAILDDLDRSDEDRALDAGRHPGELLAVLDIDPGMRVAELGAGGGYTAELLARAVGWNGTVYAQNNRTILERFAEKPWSERLAKPVMRRVVRVDREFDDPLPPEARALDLVVMNLFYHDTVWMKTDRAAMNRAIYRALAPGGRFVVIDHSARDGRGIADAETLHRIEESVVLEEVTRAGFRLGRRADFLRNPADTRDWNDSPRAAGQRRGTSDRFVLEFVKR